MHTFTPSRLIFQQGGPEITGQHLFNSMNKLKNGNVDWKKFRKYFGKPVRKGEWRKEKVKS